MDSDKKLPEPRVNFHEIAQSSDVVNKLCYKCGVPYCAVKGSVSDTSGECELCYRHRMQNLLIRVEGRNTLIRRG